jgi:uncharacterized protein (TIGR04255 family)
VPRQSRRPSKYDLVSFGHPPVAEVALAVQFAPETIDIEAFGRFARGVRDDLPTRQRQSVAPPMEERFDRVPATPSIQIRLEAPTELPRTWFLSEDGVQLVQLQHDRLTLNWRETNEDVDYPRYGALRERFEELLKLLTDALDEIGQSHAINICEVTYVNPIEVPRTEKLEDGRSPMHPDLAKIINRVRTRPRDAFLPEAEDAQLQARWRIPSAEVGGDHAPAGRLYLSAVPGLKPKGNVPIYLVNLTARLLTLHGDNKSAMEALDVAHKWVVLGFKDLTTPQMHRHWKLKERSK